MTELTQGTWVLVADGQKALFLRNEMDAQDPMLEVIRIEEQDNPADREQATDKPGRMNDTGVQQRSALAETDFHKLAKEQFADELAEILYKQAHKGRFERLVIVAPPVVLGELRAKLHKEVAARVVAELDKTLTNHPIDKIEAIVKGELDSA
ncbi:host attachment family protein [Pararhodobacter marinus]|uniref:host attachment family protein n=1 Tax=Pararhodobacter marinus TaxID=2184063 RepID=UPI003519C6A9